MHIKEHMCKISYIETINVTPHMKPVKTNDAPKKIKYTRNDGLTVQSPSLYEYVDSLH